MRKRWYAERSSRLEKGEDVGCIRGLRVLTIKAASWETPPEEERKGGRAGSWPAGGWLSHVGEPPAAFQQKSLTTVGKCFVGLTENRRNKS